MAFAFVSRRVAVALLATVSIAVLTAGRPVSAQTFTILDQTFTRATGQPKPVMVSVTPRTPGPFTLRVVSDGVASAVIELNGVAVATPKDFSAKSRTFERAIALRASNQLSVELRSKPGSSLRLVIVGDDRVPPAIRAVTSPPANAQGWNTTDVVVTFECSDAGSGVATCPPPITVTAEGGGQVVTGTAIDNVGNASTTTVAVNIDKTPPSISGSLQPPANQYGWNNSDVLVRFACQDSGSNLAECTAPVAIAAQGGEGTRDVPGIARDRAGLVATTAVRVNLDITPPTIVATPDRPPDSGQWYTAPVTVSFTCADDRSGVVTCPEPVRVISMGAEIAVPGTVTDRAGNTASVTFVLNMRAASPPGLTASLAPPPNAAGWNNTDVTVTFACTDSGSGVQTCPPPQTVAADGTHEITATASDPYGNTRTIALTVRLDRTPPAIAAATSSAANAAGWHRAPVTVLFTCDDALSGVASCPVPTGVSTEGGGQEIGGTAIDQAGNVATAAATVNLDTTPPLISAVVSSPDTVASGDVTVTFVCSDGLSGLADCPAPITVSVEGLNQAVSGTAHDLAGNAATGTASVSVDRTRPTIVASLSPSPNGAGWHNSPVTVTFTCADTGSSIASCPPPQVISANGANQVVTGEAVDAAGNRSEASVTVNLDADAPIVTLAPVTAANAEGWHNAPVRVEVACQDLLSTVASCTQAIEVLTDGEHTVSATAVDVAGNAATATMVVRLDTIAPSLVSVATPPANGAGWNNGDVALTYTCEDAGSGVVSCPPGAVARDEGADQVIAVSVADRAGNVTAASNTLNIDKTAPLIAATPLPAPNEDGWNNTPVTVSFACSDGLSDLASCTPPVLVGAEVVGEIVTGTAVDRAGNRAEATVTLNIDMTAPTLQPRPSATGWSNRDVTVTFECADAGAGISSCASPQVVTQEGQTSVVGQVTDRAGNTTSSSTEVSIDRTPPAIVAVVSPAPTGGFSREPVTVRFTCSDTGSGVNDCPAEQIVSSEGLGQVITGTARDAAGNTAESSVTINLDLSPPAIRAVASPAPNAAGWHNTPVTVTFECTDTLGVVADCPAAVTIATEGAGQVVNGTVTDQAGNEASTSITLNLDLTPPTIDAAVAPPANPLGWHAQPATVSYTCGDALSELASCTPPITVSGGAGQAVTGTAVDRAGNIATVSTVVNVDASAPGVVAMLAPTPNGAGWNNTDVTVSFDCTDSGSGVVDCPAPFTVSAEGANQLFERTVADRAGNSVVITTRVSLDRTPPTAQITGPADNAVLRTATVPVSAQVSDALSGLAAAFCGSSPVAAAATVSCDRALAPGPNTILIRVVDAAGNEATATRTVQYDPNRAPRAMPGGPYTGVSASPIAFNGSASFDPDSDPLTYSWRFGDETTGTGPQPSHAYANAGTYTVTLAVDDGYGGVHEASSTVTVTRANRVPTVRLGGPYVTDVGASLLLDASGSTDEDGDSLTASWAFGDGGTGAGLTPRYTYREVGSFTATVTITDGHGGTATGTTLVTVRATNQLPVARVGGPYRGEVNRPIAFDASTSTDPDGDTVTFEWRFGDGATGTGAQPSHTFAATGIFPVTLSVTDARGGVTSSSTQVTVTPANALPTAEANGPYTQEQGFPLALSSTGSADPDGDVLTFTWRFGDGRSNTGASPSVSYATAGTYTIELSVDDGRGGIATDTATVTVVPPATTANRDPVAVAGGPYLSEAGLPLVLDPAGSVDPDGDPLTYAWTFGDGASSNARTPGHAWAEAGTYSVTLTVTDGRGGSATVSTPATVSAATDRAPPVVSLLGPTQVLPGSEVAVVAQVADASAVTRVIFVLVDGATTEDEAAPFERAVTVPPVAAPGATVTLRATAIDAAGNAGTGELVMTIASQPDGDPPTVVLNRPEQVAPGSQARISATATDAAGVRDVTFLVNDAAIVVDREPPYEFTYPVPADSVIGSILRVAARAADFTGNEAEDAADLIVAATTDTVPPSIVLTVPPVASPGSTVRATAATADNSGISRVQLRVNGVIAADLTAAPFEIDVEVPAATPLGSLIRIDGTAVDFAGLEATASVSVRVTAPLTAGEGLVIGEVYDDQLGVPLGGARVVLTGQSELGATFAIEAETDARGAYVLQAQAGTGTLGIGKAGWTTVIRPVVIASGLAHVSVDARLTRFGDGVTISPVLGGTIADGPISVRIGSGGLAQATTFRARRLSPQGLRGILPAGWTPVDAIDLAPADIAFTGAVFESPLPAELPVGRLLHLVRWDEAASAWRVQHSMAAPETGPLSQEIPGSGQYAWVVGDIAPVPPPLPAEGELLLSAVAAPVPADATATVTPQPRVLIYEPGVRSDVRTEVPSTQAQSSGTRLQATIQETYSFTNDTVMRLDPFVQDVFFYQSPAGTQLQAAYPVSASIAFDPIALREGVIAVDVHEPANAAPMPVVAAAGGAVHGAGGARLDIPAGAVAGLTSASVQPMTAGGLGLALPGGLTFIDGVTVSLSAPLGRAGALSVARPGSVDGSATILLVRVSEIGGVTRLIFAALARVEGERIETVLELPRNGLPLWGVRESGRYAFLSVASPVAYAFGQVLGVSAAPFSDALITNNTLAIAALSRPGGTYVAAIGAAPTTLTALDVTRNDAGTATAPASAAGDELALDLRLRSEPPRITEITPPNGAVNVPPTTAVVVRFSEPIDPASIGDGTALTVSSAAGAVDGVLALSEGNTLLTFRPDGELSNNTDYDVRVAGVRDLAGNALAAPFTTRFASLDTTAPPPPPAGALRAAIPGADGFTTVTGTPGTAGAHDTVFVENVTRGTLTPVLVEPNGGFLVRVAAGIVDKLRLRLTDRGGNETIVNLPRFSDADGRVAIGPEGGDIEGPNGLRLEIAAGTFPQGSIVRLIGQTAAELGAAATPDYPLVAGFAVESSAAPQIYMNVSMPVPAGTPEGDTGIIAEVVEVFGGIRALSIVDSAIVENGRLRTASAPCPGILTGKFTRYGAYLSPLGKRNLAVSLLNLVVPRTANVVVQPMVIRPNPFMPLPTLLYPGFEFSERVYPQSPFINAILSGAKTPDQVFSSLEGGLLLPNGQVCSVMTNTCAPGQLQSCMVVPADHAMTIVVRNATTGAVINATPIVTPPAGGVGNVTNLYLVPGDTQGPGLVGASWGPNPPHVVDPNEPIELRFSEAVTFNGVPSGQPIYLQEVGTTNEVHFSRVHISDRSRKLTLTPASTLLMGRSYRILTPGMSDLAGNPFTGTLEFQTFVPTVVTRLDGSEFARSDVADDLSQTLAGYAASSLKSVGLRDVSFATLRPEQSLNGQWHTTLTGIKGGFDTSYKFFTFSLDEPTSPRALSAVVFGARSGLTTLTLPAIRMTPRTTDAGFGSPVTQALTQWADRRLYSVVGNPANRICAQPGDPGLNQWLQRQTLAGHTVDVQPGCGDLALVTSYNTLFGMVDMYDVTDRDRPIQIGHRILNDNGASLMPPAPPRWWAPPGVSVPKNIAVLPGLDITHDRNGVTVTNMDTVGLFGALNMLGLGMVDVARNIPPIEDFIERRGGGQLGTLIESQATWIYPHYQDVEVLRSRVIAIASDRTDGSGATHLEVFTPNLQPIGQPLPLGGMRPESLWVKEDFLRYDSNGDGTPEAHDAVVVTGALGSVAVLEVNAAGVPMVRGFIRTSRTPGVTGPAGLGDVTIDWLGHIDVDLKQRVAYVKARWLSAGAASPTQGLLAIDLSRALGGPVDHNADGWDDRLLGLVPLIGPGLSHQQGEVNRFRIDQERKLIYVAVETAPDDLPFMVVRTCQCTDLLARVDLRSAGISLSEFPSPDGATTSVFANAADYATGQIHVSLEAQPYTGSSVTYTLTELPFSGAPGDRILDPTAATTGTLSSGSSQIHLYLAPRPANQPLPPGSLVAIDFRDSSGNYIKRLNVEVVSLQVVAPNVVVKTRLDKNNGRVLERAANLSFYLPVEARVTVHVDGAVLARDAAGNSIPPFADIALPAGWNRIAMGRHQVPEPGTHPFVITATFEAGAAAVAQGSILHDVTITESLPIGHTFINGVDLQDGHLSISRDDLSIAGVGPGLSFSRTYSSSGIRTSGPMGANWSHNWQSSLSVDEFGTVNVSAGDGGGGRFTSTPGGGPGVTRFRPDPGYHGVLEFANDVYDYYSKARFRYRFEKPASDPNSDYLLQWVEDSNGNRLTLTYLNGTQLERVTDAAGRSITLTYGDHGLVPEPRIEQINGPMGLEVRFTYDDLGNLLTAERGPRIEAYEYSTTHAEDQHNLVRVTDPNGHATAYTYFEPSDVFPGESTAPFALEHDVLVIPQKHELVKVVTAGEGSPQAAATTYTFDYSNHATRYVTTVVDPRATATQYTLNPRGNVVEQRTPTPDGDHVTTMRWAYEDGLNDIYLTRKTDPNGRVTNYEYDANGNLQRETIDVTTGAAYAPVANAAGTAAASVITAYTYHPVFNVVQSKTDAEGNTTSYTYDPATGNLLTTTTDPLDGSGPHVIYYTYTTHTTPGGVELRGLLSTVRDPLNRLTRYENHDQWGNATSTIDPLGNVTTNTFDERGRVVSSTDSRGRSVSNTYDALDRVLTTTRHATRQPAAGRVSADRVEVSTYYPGGQKETHTDGEGHVTTFTYDALNRPAGTSIQVTDADGGTATVTTATTYDGNGNAEVETDRRGTERHMNYDALNRLRSVTLNGATIASYTYDLAGNKLTEDDLHGHTTSYSYDALYRIVRTTLPQAPYTLRARYNLVGHVVESWNANGARQAKTYDGEYRVTAETDQLGVTTTFGYDAMGNRVSVTNTANGLNITMGYDELNRMKLTTTQFTDPVSGDPVVITNGRDYDDNDYTVRITDGRGNVVLEQYNGHDALISSTVDPDGLALTTTNRYDGNGNLTDVIDPRNGDVDLLSEFDELRRPIRTTMPLRGQTLTFYDGNGNVVRTVDGRGITQRYVYDLLDRRTEHLLVESISNGGAELTMSRSEYDDAANQVRHFDAAGVATEVQLDAMHREVLITDAAGEAIVREWDGVERRAEIDRRGFRKEYDYDAIGRLIATREFGGPALTTLASVYDHATGVRVDTDRRGIEIVTTFDPIGRLRRVARRHPALVAGYGAAEVVIDEYVYDGAGLVVDARNARGAIDRFTYDGAGRRVTATAAFGTADAATTTFTYDAAGNLLTSKDARAHGGVADVTYTYDAANRRSSEANGAGETTTFAFDEADRVVRIIQPKGAAMTTLYAYDELGSLTAVDETRGGAGGVTRTAYDERRNRIAVRDAAGRLTTYRYDQLGRLTDEFRHVAAAPLPTGRGGDLGPGAVNDARHTHYEYDAAGNQTVIVDPAGQRVAKTYDYLGRLETKVFSAHAAGPGGAEVYPQLLRTVFEYDPSGNPLRVAETKRLSASSGDVTEVVVSEYDHLERLVLQTNADNKEVRARFNVAGDRLSETDPDNQSTVTTYDLLGRARTVSSGGDTTRYEYYPDGLQRLVTYPNGMTATFDYDPADRMRELRNEIGVGVLVSSQRYTYDANSNRTSMIEQQPLLGLPATTIYDYDVLNRLSSVDYGPAGAVAYSYDATGNRLTEQGTGAGGAVIDRTFDYDGLAQLRFVQDAADPAASLAFDHDRNGNTVRRLTGVLQNGTIAAPTATQRFAFDIRDRLAEADMRSGGGTVTFGYDGGGRRTRMASSLFDIRYAYGQRDVIQEYSGTSGVATQRYTWGNGLVALGAPLPGGGLDNSYFLADALKNTLNVVDANGATAQSTAYDPWGQVRARTGTSPNRRGFSGHYEDTETGLIYMGARYYDPTTGRFLSRDAAPGVATDPISASKYVYAHANPLTFIDPTGNSAEPAQAAAEPDLSQAGTAELLGHWLLGVGAGAAKAVAAPVAGLLRSGFLGLTDLAQVGLGYLAISANPQYVDEIGGMMGANSDIGKKATEEYHKIGGSDAVMGAAIVAIGESATGFVKDTATSVVTLPARLKAAAESGDPEQVGAAAVELVQVGQQVKGPANATLRRVEQVKITADILSRQRISKMADVTYGSPIFGQTPGLGKLPTLSGKITVGDAWTLAGLCFKYGATGCSFVGGFTGRSVSNLFDNLSAKRSLGHGPIERKWVDGKYSEKAHGDIDMIVDRPGQPTMTNWHLAKATNAKMSAPMLDTARQHGVLGEYLPDDMLPGPAREMFRAQQGLPPNAPIRAFDYWTKGVVGFEGSTQRVSPLIKGGKTILRGLSDDAFEYRNIGGFTGERLRPVDWMRLILFEESRSQMK